MLLPLRSRHGAVCAVRAKDGGGGQRALLVATAYRSRPHLFIDDCERDARQMQRALRARGFSDTTMLLGASATRDNVASHLRALVSRSSQCSQVLFFFSGHGTQVAGDETDGRDEAIVCDDERLLHDNEFRSIMASCACDCVLIFDCCTSGSMTDAETLSLVPGRRRLTIGACQDGRIASQHRGSGVLTRELIRRLNTDRLRPADLHGAVLLGGQVTSLSGSCPAESWL